jgi:hypothetical protein
MPVFKLCIQIRSQFSLTKASLLAVVWRISLFFPSTFLLHTFLLLLLFFCFSFIYWCWFHKWNFLLVNCLTEDDHPVIIHIFNGKIKSNITCAWNLLGWNFGYSTSSNIQSNSNRVWDLIFWQQCIQIKVFWNLTLFNLVPTNLLN